MGIHLNCEPHKTVTREEAQNYPPYTIFIDGSCKGAPFATSDGLILNLNHHEDVETFATCSASMQAYYEVMTGLYERKFRLHGKPIAFLEVNASDQDVGGATFVLMYPEYVHRPKLRKLIEVIDVLDRSAGLFPLDADVRRELLPELCWIFEPFTASRARGEEATLTPEQCKEQILEMHCRMKASLYGRGKRITPDERYEVLARYPLWSVVREIGQHARYGMSKDGIDAFLSVISEKPGHNRHTLCRLSHTTPFPLPKFYDALNEAEGIPPDAIDRHGGSSTAGGSPRKRGSRLTYKEVAKALESVIARTQETRQALREQVAAEALERGARQGNGKHRCCKKNRRKHCR